MLKNLSIKIKKFIDNPKTSLVMGIILLITGVLESMETVLEEMMGLEIGIHHGIIIFAFARILDAIAHLYEGIEDINNYEVKAKSGS